MTWIVVAVGLLLLVFLHELGHFSVALLVGIRPRSFYVGFPPAILKTERKGIEYGLGAIPLGGMVRIPGMNRPAGRDVEAFMAAALRENPELTPLAQQVRRALEAEDFEAARVVLPALRAEVERSQLSTSARRSANRALRDLDEGTGLDAYWRQATWKRIAVIAAGPLANILVAFVIFFTVFATGAPSQQPSTKVGQVESNTPAAAAGLKAGDRVVAVDGHPAATFDAVSRLIRSSRGKPITVTVNRGGQTLTLGPRKTVQVQNRWIWGFVPSERLVSYPLGTSFTKAANECWRVVTATGSGFSGIFKAKDRAQISGPVGIVRTSQAALKAGFSWYLLLLGLISMSLALLNLLPLLPLDGGHILFSLIEAVRRRALAREVYERVSVAGIALILLLMYIALHNDLSSTPH
ncbi:MAG: regulator of sigma protease [Gaiellaceae bacterium]|jgi:regulator of sigma E protease|nr:regulator of sigma protease [Gaiellaceae bacterium]